MPAEYHHLSPVILTDDLYETLVPALTITTSAPQRNVAYLIAEQMMIRAIKAPLLPTAITGTFDWPAPEPRIDLPHEYVRSVDRIVLKARDSAYNCVLTEYSACAVLRNYYGYIDVVQTNGAFASQCGGVAFPTLLECTYTAGLATGTAAQDASLHMSLGMLARLQLLEMVDPGALEGGAGDPGISSYSNQGYSETRSAESVKKTPFGNSTVANKAFNLIQHLIIYRALRFS